MLINLSCFVWENKKNKMLVSKWARTYEKLNSTILNISQYNIVCLRLAVPVFSVLFFGKYFIWNLTFYDKLCVLIHQIHGIGKINKLPITGACYKYCTRNNWIFFFHSFLSFHFGKYFSFCWRFVSMDFRVCYRWKCSPIKHNSIMPWCIYRSIRKQKLNLNAKVSIYEKKYFPSLNAIQWLTQYSIKI